MDYREEIKNYMKQNRISYAALAEAMGVTRQRVWNLLNKKGGSMNLNTLNRICDVLGLDITIL